METINIISMISGIILNILLIAFFIYAFIWFKGTSQKIDRIEAGITAVSSEVPSVFAKISAVAADIPPVIAKISSIAEDIRHITEVSKRTVDKGGAVADEILQKGRDLAHTVSVVEDSTAAAYNNAKNLISALRAGVRTFGQKIK
jgi:uncharacterized protein YoxC